MRIRSQTHLPHSLHQLLKVGSPLRSVRITSVFTKKPISVLSLGAIAVRDRSPDDDVFLSRIARQQHLEAASNVMNSVAPSCWLRRFQLLRQLLAAMSKR